MRKYLGSLVFVLMIFSINTLVGCASVGPAITADQDQPLSQGSSRIVVKRNDAMMYMALSARVQINGEKLQSLSRDDSVVKDIKAGKVTVYVDTASSPGGYSFSFNAEPDHIYNLEVSPRGDSFLPGATLGLAGLFVDSSVNEQSGLFQIAPKSSAPIDKAKILTSNMDNGDSAKRLAKLKNMLDQGLIDQSDYNQKKAEILKGM